MLKDQLEKVYRGLKKQIPDVVTAFDADTKKAVANKVGMKGLTVGDTAPDFQLPDYFGEPAMLTELIKKGPVVLNFFRGFWCPYCNAELMALTGYLPEILGIGGTLVSIHPQTSNEPEGGAAEWAPRFPVLTDEGNVVARQFGLVFSVSEKLRSKYLSIGLDIPKFNGDDSFELPVPATYILDRERVIRAAHVHADYKKRMEPSVIVEVLKRLRA